MKVKVSGTGWLCAHVPGIFGDEWMPVFELTPRQINEYKEVEETLNDRTKKSKVNTDTPR